MRVERSAVLWRTVVALALGVIVLVAAQGAHAAVDVETVESFIAKLWPEAKARGVTRDTFDRAFAEFKPDPALGKLNAKQPEFERPLGAYVEERVTATRIEAGRRKAGEHAALLQSIENRFGVDSKVVLAIWGMESAYGASKGNRTVVRSLATLAMTDARRAPFWRRELVSALVLAQERGLAPDALVGSWAGAMGHTQFIPSTYARFAVDFDRDGQRDLTGSVADALASTANYLAKSGWVAGVPWGFEVKLPQRFDYGWAAPGRKRTLAEWMVAGVKPGPAAGHVTLGTELQLVMPVGAGGPSFLVTQNFKAILRYNQSVAYALSVGHLADRIAGGAAFQAAWPMEPPLSRAEREELHSLLSARGPAPSKAPAHDAKAAIRAAQRALRLPDDGYANAALLTRLRGTRQSSL